MLTLLFVILLVSVFFKMISLAIRLAWGILRVFFTVIFFPLIMIGLFCVGLVKLAIPILLIVGLVSLIAQPARLNS